jgi:hypothetical protein
VQQTIYIGRIDAEKLGSLFIVASGPRKPFSISPHHAVFVSEICPAGHGRTLCREPRKIQMVVGRLYNYWELEEECITGSEAVL